MEKISQVISQNLSRCKTSSLANDKDIPNHDGNIYQSDVRNNCLKAAAAKRPHFANGCSKIQSIVPI